MKEGMLRFLKVFVISFFLFCFLIAVGLFSYIRIFNPLDDIAYSSDFGADDINSSDDDNRDNNDGGPLNDAIKDSKRINVLLVGLERVRTDTIMFISFDRVDKSADIISIPRDTYYERKGYSGEFLKINAIYQNESIDGLIDAVESILNVPIHKYVTVDYKAVSAGVDALGGIEIDIPMRMKYTDIFDTPPLYIDFQPGKQLLDGADSLKLLRFRRNDDGTGYPRGDIGRVEMQQEFMKEAVKKLISFRIPKVIQDVYPYIKTNFSITELLSLATEAIGFSIDNLNTTTLPWDEYYAYRLSFVKPNEEEILKLIYDMYGLSE